MGGANEICTDKTGTLTQNRMTVMTIFTENAITDGIKCAGLAERQVCEALCQSVTWNCSAFVETELDGQKVCKGNVTEVGLLNYLMNSGIDAEMYIKQKDGKMEMQIPFDSRRKRQTTAIKTENGVRVFVKGAPEVVIQRCNSFIAEDGEVQEMDEEKAQTVS